jgi:hypothetical protein
MALPIISASTRLAEKSGVKLVLLGKSGIGKTTQLKTLPEDRTLFVDLEAGDLAVRDWQGDTLRPQTWPEFRDLVVFLAGPNPALPVDAPYSQAHFDHVCERYGDPAQLAKYDTYFVDSITVLARLALIWAKVQPQAMSERTGKPDTRGAYGLLGQEMLTALIHLQHARGKHVVFVAILDEKLDDLPRLHHPHAQPLRLPRQGPLWPAGSARAAQPARAHRQVRHGHPTDPTPISIQSGVTHVRMERFQRR